MIENNCTDDVLHEFKCVDGLSEYRINVGLVLGCVKICLKFGFLLINVYYVVSDVSLEVPNFQRNYIMLYRYFVHPTV